jgi:alkanesulfonate monooxygenase SsuD/methylene tetrahydromethanopterin reductase-like flavin-dependent oxidoreductase (luciferase family)
VSHHGKYYDAEIRAIRPAPYTKPHPRFAIAVSSEDSLRWAARHGYPVMFSFVSADQMHQRLAVYAADMRSAGFGEDQIERNLSQVSISRYLYLAETDEQAREEVPEPTFRLYRSLGELRNKYLPKEGQPAPALPKEAWSNPYATPEEAVFDLMDRTFFAGSATTVARQVAELRDAGCRNLMFRMSWGEMEHAKVIESMERFARDVMPLFAAEEEQAVVV